MVYPADAVLIAASFAIFFYPLPTPVLFQTANCGGEEVFLADTLSALAACPVSLEGDVAADEEAAGPNDAPVR
ncbi:MAG: hypothetical protein FRX49_09575 [Trebouxia sp. A1-2]|nr:MAG: hypothetical protein FRX49_09575 [Trebouxia sp. A1-2]